MSFTKNLKDIQMIQTKSIKHPRQNIQLDMTRKKFKYFEFDVFYQIINRN